MRGIIFAIIAFFATAFVAPSVAALAWRWGAVDQPDGGRKRHQKRVPLLGGMAVFFGIAVAMCTALATGDFPGAFIKTKYIFGMLIAAVLLLIGGSLDDKYRLRPRQQIVWPVLAALVVIASGIGITSVTNPFGGVIRVDMDSFTVLWLQGIPYKITPFADTFTFLWIIGMTYTTKLLDGLDGLVAGLSVIGALVIAAVGVMKEVAQPDTTALALIVAGAFLGFLLHNFSPARLFLGEGGSTLAGFLLGTLAVISGGKIATTLLVLGLPIADAAVVIIRRILNGRSPVSGDRSHLHFRLLDVGLTTRQAVLFYYLVATVFGVSTLILKGPQKLIALGVLCAFLPFAPTLIARIKNRRRS